MDEIVVDTTQLRDAGNQLFDGAFDAFEVTDIFAPHTSNTVQGMFPLSAGAHPRFVSILDEEEAQTKTTISSIRNSFVESADSYEAQDLHSAQTLAAVPPFEDGTGSPGVEFFE